MVPLLSKSDGLKKFCRLGIKSKRLCYKVRGRLNTTTGVFEDLDGEPFKSLNSRLVRYRSTVLKVGKEQISIGTPETYIAPWGDGKQNGFIVKDNNLSLIIALKI